MSNARRLRELLASGDFLVAPGAYDGLTARLVEQAGFALAYMTGAGTAAACGYPDYGLVTLGEMVDNAARMTAALSIPLIADADTGYGNELNVTRTVRAFEARGVAGIHLEDQVSPKRCGHLLGKEVVPRATYLNAIRAAVAARRDADFVLIARTDARAVLGLDEAIARANAALDLGADLAFVEAPQTLEEVAEVPRRVHGPCVLNVVPGGRTPLVDAATAAAMGYRLAIHPALLLYPVVSAAEAALAALRASGAAAAPPAGLDIAGLFQRCGAAEWDALRARFADDGAQA